MRRHPIAPSSASHHRPDPSPPRTSGLPLTGARWVPLEAARGRPGWDIPGRDEPAQPWAAVRRRCRVATCRDRGWRRDWKRRRHGRLGDAELVDSRRRLRWGWRGELRLIEDDLVGDVGALPLVVEREGAPARGPGARELEARRLQGRRGVLRRRRGGLASREVDDAASSIGRSYATATTTARTAHWSKQSLKELFTEKTTELKHFR
jgi:hypothetical protein